MNIRSIYVLAAAIAIVSCGGNSTTTLKGKFAADEIPSEVHITVAGIDTVVTVADGTFTLKVPVSKGELGMVESDAGRLQFISDGSELLVDYSGERPRVTSDNPKSLTRAFNAYVDKSVSLVNQVVGEDDASTRAYDSYMSLQKKTIAEHKNDFIGLYALQNVYFDYTPEELKKILRRSASLLGVGIDEPSLDEMAKRSRGTPRVANRMLKRIRDFSQVKGNGSIDLDITREGLEALGVDELGLEKLDRDIIMTIIERFGGGPVGIDTIAASLGEERVTLEDVNEPFLIQSGLLYRTLKGRMVSRDGYRHFGLEYPADKLEGQGDGTSDDIEEQMEM